MSSTVPIPMILNIPLLERVRTAAGDFVPLHELGPDLDRVRIDLDALVAFGFGIEAAPLRRSGLCGTGRAALSRPDRTWTGDPMDRPADCSLEPSRQYQRRGGSGGHSGSNDGLVVLARTRRPAAAAAVGRGSPRPERRSLMSVVLFPPPHLAPAVPESAFGCAWLTALAAVATAEVVAAWTGRDATIKWPNDVRVGGRKIAGILVERALASSLPASPCPLEPALEPGGAVIGIGLNVNLDRDNFPPELRGHGHVDPDRAPTVCSVDRSALARDLIRRLDTGTIPAGPRAPGHSTTAGVPAANTSGVSSALKRRLADWLADS